MASGISWRRAAAVLLLLALMRLVPVPAVERAPRICLVRAVRGVDCPGCGMTRALCHLLHGDWRAARALNPRCVVVFPLLGLVACTSLRKPAAAPARG